jgi:hypothetical protein
LSIHDVLAGQIAFGDYGRLWARVNVALVGTTSAAPFWVNNTVEIVGGIVTAGESEIAMGKQIDVLFANGRVCVASVDHTFRRGAILCEFWGTK